MDYKIDDVIYLPFTTRAFATGIPTVLAGTPDVEIYENASITPIAEGVGKLTLTISLNSVVGFNMATATLSAANGFEAGKHYTLVIKTGTVDSVSVVGEVVGEFTIQSAPVNWANITAPTTANNLSGTNIDVDQIVASVSGNVDGNVTGSVATLGTLPTIPANWLTAAGTAADFGTEIGTACWATAARTLTAATNITSTGGTTFTQTGDSFALIGTAGAGLTNLGASGNNWNTVVPDAAGVAPTAQEIEDEVWNALQSAHVGVGSMGVLATEMAALQTDLDTLTAGVTLTAASVDLIWDELLAGHVTADSAGLVLNEWQDGGRLDNLLDGATAPTAAANAIAVWDAVQSSHVTVGSFGVIATEIASILTDTTAIVLDTNSLEQEWADGGRLDNLLDGAASAGDPWTTALPGAYGAGTAGEILGDWKNGGRLDLLLDAIPTTAMRGTDNAALATGVVLTAAGVDAIWDEPTLAHTTLDTFGADMALILGDTNELQADDYPTTIAALQTDLDTLTAGVTLTATGADAVLKTSTFALAMADAIWDEVLSGATHNTSSSAGRRLRTLQTGGAYEGGSIWVDTVNGTAGTVDDENGVVGLPVDTWADALTLSASLGLKNFHIANGSTVTLSASSANYLLYGHEWTLALGGFSVASTMVIDAIVSGTGTGAEAEFEDCIIGTMTIPPSQYYNCSFTGTQTLVSAGDYRYINCQSGIAGTGAPTFALGTGSMTVEFRRWSGGINLTGIGADDTITISGELGTIDLGSATAGTVEVRGTYKALTNASSGVTVNTAGAILGGDVAAILVDTGTSIPARMTTAQNDLDIITGASGVNLLTATQASIDAIEADTNSLQGEWANGGRLDLILDTAAAASSGALLTGTADSGSTTTLVDAAALTQADTDYWKGDLIEFTDGTLDGQVRLITGFAPATDTITFYPATTVAVSTHTYQILAAADGDAKAVLVAAIGNVNVVNSTSVSRVAGTSIKAYVGENLTTPALTPNDVDGSVLDTTAITLKVVIEDRNKDDVVTILDADITKTSTTFLFTSTAAANDSEAVKAWSCRRTDNDVVVAHGEWIVEYQPE